MTLFRLKLQLMLEIHVRRVNSTYIGLDTVTKQKRNTN